MIENLINGYEAELALVRATLFAETFSADQEFRPIPTTRVQPVNTETTSTVTFQDERLKGGIKYFTRFFTESGGLLSGESDFLEFIPILEEGFMQVLPASKTDTVSSTSTTMVDIPGMSIVITPSAVDSLILLFAKLSFSSNNQTHMAYFQFVRDATPLVGDAAGARQRATQTSTGTSIFSPHPMPLIVPDSPGTTSPVTYKIQWRTEAGLIHFLNRSGADSNSSLFARDRTDFIVIEV